MLSTKLAVAIVVLPWLATQLADTGLVGLPLLPSSPPGPSSRGQKNCPLKKACPPWRVRAPPQMKQAPQACSGCLLQPAQDGGPPCPSPLPSAAGRGSPCSADWRTSREAMEARVMRREAPAAPAPAAPAATAQPYALQGRLQGCRKTGP